ncbi:MAG: hypothetical protein JRJ62_16975 [Deltaproteobacteria bacterium]|nr:hypothetical protein [Deltaproteobacteria bacterium]
MGVEVAASRLYLFPPVNRAGVCLTIKPISHDNKGQTISRQIDTGGCPDHNAKSGRNERLVLARGLGVKTRNEGVVCLEIKTEKVH